MKNDRRKFLQLAGALSAGAMIAPQFACKEHSKSFKKGFEEGYNDARGIVPKGSIAAFGLQLYTLRDIIGDDPKATLKEVASFGIKQIESYDGEQGMFWGMGNKDFSAYLGDLGMSLISSHVNINEDFEKKAGQAAEIGMKYLVCPYIGPQTSMDAWKKVTERFNECGKICNEAGIKFAYHNHAYTFKPFSGMIPHDFLMDNTDPDLVDHQMDIYWVVTGGADPVEYLKKYSGRFTLCHVKDRLKDAPDEEREASCNVGTGKIDFPSILKVAKDHGMEYFIIEQERYDNSTPMKSVQAGAEYLSTMQFAS